MGDWRSLVTAIQMMACASASIFDTNGSSIVDGSCLRIRATRSRTSAAAASTSRVVRKVIVIWLTSSRLLDLMVLMPSMPDSESSSGCVTALLITWAVAPLYTVRTETMGGSILGYSRTAMRE